MYTLKASEWPPPLGIVGLSRLFPLPSARAPFYPQPARWRNHTLGHFSDTRVNTGQQTTDIGRCELWFNHSAPKLPLHAIVNAGVVMVDSPHQYGDQKHTILPAEANGLPKLRAVPAMMALGATESTREPTAMLVAQYESTTSQYGAQAVLKGVSFEIHSGQRLGLIGANGSGKTTICASYLARRRLRAVTYRWLPD